MSWIGRRTLLMIIEKMKARTKEEILELITSVQDFEDAGSLNETASGEE